MPTLACEPYIVHPNDKNIEVRYAQSRAILNTDLLLRWYQHILAERFLTERLAGRGVATIRDPKLLAEFSRLKMMRDLIRLEIAQCCPCACILDLDLYTVQKGTLDVAFVIDELVTDLAPNVLSAFTLLAQTTVQRKGTNWSFIQLAPSAVATRATFSHFACSERRMIGDAQTLSRLWSRFMAGNQVHSPIQWTSLVV